jgi:hypothetical protein
MLTIDPYGDSPFTERWVKVSHALWHRLPQLPMIVWRLQTLSRVSVIVSQLEAQSIPSFKDGIPNPAIDVVFALSNLWLSEVFEILRLIQKNFSPKNRKDKLSELKSRLAIIRNPIAKYELSGKPRQISVPMAMIDHKKELVWCIKLEDDTVAKFCRNEVALEFLEALEATVCTG